MTTLWWLHMIYPWVFRDHSMRDSIIIPCPLYDHSMTTHANSMIMPWSFHDDSMAVPWPFHGHSMITSGPYHYNSMIIPWLHDNSMTIPWLFVWAHSPSSENSDAGIRKSKSWACLFVLMFCCLPLFYYSFVSQMFSFKEISTIPFPFLWRAHGGAVEPELVAGHSAAESGGRPGKFYWFVLLCGICSCNILPCHETGSVWRKGEGERSLGCCVLIPWYFHEFHYNYMLIHQHNISMMSQL
jgi:hypothetical protein